MIDDVASPVILGFNLQSMRPIPFVGWFVFVMLVGISSVKGLLRAVEA